MFIFFCIAAFGGWVTSCVDIVHSPDPVAVTNYYYEVIEITITNDVINEITITNSVTNTVINEVVITNYVDVAGWVSDFDKFDTLYNEYLPNGIMTTHNAEDDSLINVKFAFIQRRGEMFKFEKKGKILKNQYKYLYWNLTEKKKMSNLALN